MTTEDFKRKKQRLDFLKNEVARLEGRKETLEKNYRKEIEDLKKIGILNENQLANKIESIQNKIKKLDFELNKSLTDLESLLSANE